MFVRVVVASLLMVGCTSSAETPAPAGEAVKTPETKAVETKAVEAKAVETKAEEAKAEETKAVATPAANEPVVSWWCTCYYKHGERGPEPLTACRASQQDCAKLEKSVMAGKQGIVYASVTHPCQESKAAHPGDLYGGRDVWEPSKKAGAWLSVGTCRLPGSGKEVDLEARMPEADNILSREKIGELKLGMKAPEVVALIGEPASRGRNELWGADGAYHQDWNWPALGLTLDMASRTRKGDKDIESIRVKAPSTLKTAKGITIGSSRAEAIKLYGKLRDPDFPEDEDGLIAGSIYGGLMFDFAGGKVTSIFLGAAAE